jgi:hypothetical protein
MGMANKAPEARYVRKHNISHHALERFRERVEEDVKCRSNHDVSNLLDEKICQATNVYTVRDPRAPEAITKLHEIDLRSGTYYVVVRDGTAVTVLDATMVKDNYSLENWKPTLNAPFTKDALRSIQATPPRKLTLTDEAIMRGDLPPPKPVAPSASEPSPIEAAGIAYAQALKHKNDCELAVLRARDGLAQAETTLQDACGKLADVTKTLMNLATGKV